MPTAQCLMVRKVDLDDAPAGLEQWPVLAMDVSALEALLISQKVKSR